MPPKVLSLPPSYAMLTHLNEFMTTLGTTKASMWPFFEFTGTLVSGIGLGDLIPSETSGTAEALEDDFAPLLHFGGIHSYHFHPTGDHHLAGIDSAAYTFGDATVDSAFSVGALILPNDVSTVALLAKYDATAAEEWAFRINSAGKLQLELYDASANASEIGLGATALSLGQWQHVVVTYDGVQTEPDVNFYVNGAQDGGDGTTTETGSYVAMENTATPLLVGASDLTATPAEEFHGRMALPFITGKALSAAEVLTLYRLTREMAGWISF